MLVIFLAAFGGALVGVSVTRNVFVSPHPAYQLIWLAGCALIFASVVVQARRGRR